ncbi:WAP four-disulfide core domain protein 2 [Trichinella spiralis]|uniref:WAP four-disulfide core domain protein 2 n=1 Tax=Trichinella spiralis TaxID=6334 RepID=UPI0001EFCB4D|nr:WAP four-disulfide core domain protein 2 [Trichinella spiralis]
MSLVRGTLLLMLLHVAVRVVSFVACTNDKQPVGLCGNNLECPDGYACEDLVCCPVEKSGQCPEIVGSILRERGAEDLCKVDYDCPSIRKCCETMLGKRCLFPIQTNSRSNIFQAVRPAKCHCIEEYNDDDNDKREHF